ncbi:hypothetical protein LSAT2_011099, partial [Lamellibrachia satsuma]
MIFLFQCPGINMARDSWAVVAVMICVAVSTSYGGRLPRSVASDCTADVILVIDKSGSMSGSYNTVLRFAKTIVSGLPRLSHSQTRVGIITFASSPSIQVPIGAYADKTDLLRKIDRLPTPGGGTSIYRAISKMHAMFRADRRFADKSSTRFTGILITDGQDSSLANLVSAASAAHRDGIKIISIGVGNVNTQQINAVASDPAYALIKPSVAQLGQLYSKVIQYTCEAVVVRNACARNPCKNRGTCKNEGNNYSCICVAGYVGGNCQTERNECASNPCRNGGTCSDQVNKYSCSCVPGYVGYNCQIDTNECASNPCKNGATCNDEVNKYSCSCVPGYVGYDCQTDTNECASNPCQNGGTCNDEVNKYSCDCGLGYAGVNCQIDECFRTNYTHGQLWLQYRPNCHKYVVCEPRDDGKYIRHLMTCAGALYWNQRWHACDWTKTGDCEDGSVESNTTPQPTGGPCPYERDVNTPSIFYSVSDHREVQRCAQGQEFSEDKCTCLGPAVTSCSDDLLLHFNFENGFTDVTCHHAVANKYGDGTVALTTDPGRLGKVARLDGRGYLEVPFIRTWFANNDVNTFTISLWYNRLGRSDATYGALVNNGDSVENAGFSLRAVENNKLVAKIRTDSGEKSLTVDVKATSSGWHHVVYVYSGQRLTIYVDSAVVNSVPISGYLVNNDVPMNVGFDDAKYFFDGLMDEV